MYIAHILPAALKMCVTLLEKHQDKFTYYESQRGLFPLLNIYYKEIIQESQEAMCEWPLVALSPIILCFRQRRMVI